MGIAYQQVPSPSFVLEEALLRRNLELMHHVQKEAGVSIVVAFKGFAMWGAFELVKKYLKGAAASSLNEARLCYEELGTRAHSYCVAFRPEEFGELLTYSSHLTFNSLNEFHRYAEQVAQAQHKVSCGLRVNPGYSDVEVELYNPAAPDSRLGESPEAVAEGLPEGIEGLHFHTLCESSSHTLEHLLAVVEEKFGHLLPQIQWINMGGGHLMTRKGYDLEHLIQLLKTFKAKHQVELIMEPGSAVAWETGVLVARVLDIIERGGTQTALLDVSFTAHMPDTLEMPYRPRIQGADEKAQGQHRYRLGGVSCLAGDYLAEYSFDQPLTIGQKLVFEDMIHYTMVKTTMFNGVHHPNIAVWTEQHELKVLREFGYEDYRGRLS